jgi:hypothetical protein
MNNVNPSFKRTYTETQTRMNSAKHMYREIPRHAHSRMPVWEYLISTTDFMKIYHRKSKLLTIFNLPHQLSAEDFPESFRHSVYVLTRTSRWTFSINLFCHLKLKLFFRITGKVLQMLVSGEYETY